jgi:CheY-like chemotaxis protein
MTSEPTILVLEDERPQILALRATLQPIGRVVDFSDPQHALDYLHQQEVDAAVVDIHMPRMPLNGVEFIRAVRSFDRHLAVIIRTGDTSIEIAEHAIELQAFRRVIKSKTSVQELREVLRAGIAETRDRRKMSRDAAATAGVSRQLEETLGSIEDELTASECYQAMLHSMRNQLTAVAGFAEAWSALAKGLNHRVLMDAAAENDRVVTRMLDDVIAFLDGPFAERQTLIGGNNHADVNATLSALRKRFASASAWTAQQKCVEISSLHQPLLALATPLRLLSALRHGTEFCLSASPHGARVDLKSHFVVNLEDQIERIDEPRVVFNRPSRANRLGYVAFEWRTGPVSHTLEQIRQQFHSHPEDPRKGNLHMISLGLGATGCSVVVHVSRDRILRFHLFVPTAE